jgi:hypothetical protein
MVSKDYKEYVRNKLMSLETNRRTKLTEEFKKKFASEIKEIEQLAKEVNYEYDFFHKMEKDFEDRIKELSKKAPNEVNVSHIGWAGSTLTISVNTKSVYSKDLEPILTIILQNLSAAKSKRSKVVNVNEEIKKFEEILEKTFNEMIKKNTLSKVIVS